MNDEETHKWSDYRTEIINSSEYANQLYIRMHDPRHDSIESYGNDKAELKKVMIKDVKSNRIANIVKGGEVIKLEIEARARTKIKNVIVGFIIKNEKGLTLLGENTNNKIERVLSHDINEGQIINAQFIFTIPLLPKGQYSVSVSVASGSQEDHEILTWQNEALVLRSECTSISAGLAGVQCIKLISE